MISTRFIALSAAAALSLLLAACGKQSEPESPASGASTSTSDHDHDHGADGHAHGDDEQDHDHEEVPLGKTLVGDVEVECWQGHGEATSGKELHLVVKLPYNDQGATVVRAWIGAEDRLASMVAKADYAPSHDDYDLHVEAPSPLPTNAKWWIEIEKPDGTKQVGSIALR